MIRKCDFCGKEYETKLYWWRFCSDECYQAYVEEKESRLIKCEICGSEFHPSSSRAKYCCDKCRKIAHKRQIDEWHKNNPEKVAEAGRRWIENHPDRAKKRNYNNYYNHLEKRREHARKKQKLYYQTHKEEIKRYRQAHRKEINEQQRRRYWQKKIEACKAEHNDCFDCPTLNGECLYDY